MQSVVSYTLEKCTKCLHCIKICPTDAITLKDKRVRIDKDKCINCGRCVDACNYQGLQTKGSTLADLENYDYCIALVPTAVYAHYHSVKKIANLFKAIESLGFDEVVDLSQYDGVVYKELVEYIKINKDASYLISSFCPVINKLVNQKYPMLQKNIVPLAYPADVAANDIRKKSKDKGNRVGIFLLCECIAKLTFGKYPYGREDTEIDHAIALADIFPIISRNMDDQLRDISINEEGLRYVSANHFITEVIEDKCFIADSLDKVELALETLEFNQVKDGRFAYLANCFNGCIGGNLLWGNLFDKQLHVSQLLPQATAPTCPIEHQDLYAESVVTVVKDKLSLEEKLQQYDLLMKQLELLPGLDCGACGYPSCRTMAEEIISGKATIRECRILKIGDIEHENQ